MGQTLNLSCNCGYKKDMQIGSGLLSIREDTIRRLFDPEELDGFDKALEDGDAGFFVHTQKIGYCKACSDLFSVAELSYGPDAQKKYVLKPCPKCGGQLTTRDNPGACPKCGKELNSNKIGLMWD